MLCSKMQMNVAKASVSGRVSAPVIVTRSTRRTTVSVRADNKPGVNTYDRINHVSVGGPENPGSPDVNALIDSGGRLPGGKKKTVRSKSLPDMAVSIDVKIENLICFFHRRSSRVRPLAWVCIPPRSSSRLAIGMSSALVGGMSSRFFDPANDRLGDDRNCCLQSETRPRWRRWPRPSSSQREATPSGRSTSGASLQSGTSARASQAPSGEPLSCVSVIEREARRLAICSVLECWRSHAPCQCHA